MKKIISIACLLFSFLSFPAFATTLSFSSPPTLTPGQSVNLSMQLLDKDGKTLTENDLKEVHTKKFHLLIVDSSLTDYQHIHPDFSASDNTFKTAFTPHTNNSYYIWADITPNATKKQEYISVVLDGKEKATPDKKVSTDTTVAGYQFTLSFDQPLSAGKPSLGTITVANKKSGPAANLEPVLGAFAHIVGFNETVTSVAHVHPMGPEPTKATDRSGPTVNFHFMPHDKGFMKLFAQFKIDGKDVFVPFGVTVD